MTYRSILIVASFGLLASPLSGQIGPRLYQEACDAGDVVSCNILGLMYFAGEGVVRNPARAAVLYQRACEGGEVGACTNLGVLYRSGQGVAEDHARAARLYARACDGGDVVGCDNLRTIDQAIVDAMVAGFQRSGQVEDAQTGELLVGAIVEVPELGIQAVSDDSGRVDLGRLPTGRYRLTAERFGYELLREGELQVPWNADFLILLNPAAVVDPAALGRIVGRVTEEGENLGISDVEVTVLNLAGVETVTDGRGRFDLRGLAPGLLEVQFTHLGYAPRTTTLIVQPGGTVEVTATISTEPIELEPIEVTVRSSSLEQNGFYERVSETRGNHFTRQDLDWIDPVRVAEIFDRIPNVAVQYIRGAAQAVLRRGHTFDMAECVLAVYIDGVPTFDSNLNLVPPENIEAIEIYDGLSTPIEFRRNPCGTVLLWTKP